MIIIRKKLELKVFGIIISLLQKNDNSSYLTIIKVAY